MLKGVGGFTEPQTLSIKRALFYWDDFPWVTIKHQEAQRLFEGKKSNGSPPFDDHFHVPFVRYLPEWLHKPSSADMVRDRKVILNNNKQFDKYFVQ